MEILEEKITIVVLQGETCKWGKVAIQNGTACAVVVR